MIVSIDSQIYYLSDSGVEKMLDPNPDTFQPAYATISR